MLQETFYMASIISTIVLAITYLISYYSVISPCNLVFNEYDLQEKKLIYSYNGWFNQMFKGYAVTVIGMALIGLCLESAVVFISVQIMQLVFLSAGLVMMIFMYMRSIDKMKSYYLSE